MLDGSGFADTLVSRIVCKYLRVQIRLIRRLIIDQITSIAIVGYSIFDGFALILWIIYVALLDVVDRWRSERIEIVAWFVI